MPLAATQLQLADLEALCERLYNSQARPCALATALRTDLIALSCLPLSGGRTYAGERLGRCWMIFEMAT